MVEISISRSHPFDLVRVPTLLISSAVPPSDRLTCFIVFPNRQRKFSRTTLVSHFIQMAIRILKSGVTGIITIAERSGRIGYLLSKMVSASADKKFEEDIAFADPSVFEILNFRCRNWLEGFAYRIKLGPGVFLLAILVSLLIAIVTVGYKSVKAALVNPVRALRSE